MSFKRLITLKDRELIKDLKKYRGKKLKDLSEEEKDELFELMAKKLGFL